MTYDGQPVTGMTYSNCQLTWSGGGGGTAGSILFQNITGITDKPLPPNTYTGVQFIGTITVGSGAAQGFMGRAGSGPIPAPPAPAETTAQKAMLYINYILMGVGIAMFLKEGYNIGKWVYGKFTSSAPADPAPPPADPAAPPAGDTPAPPAEPAAPPAPDPYPPPEPPAPPESPAPPEFRPGWRPLQLEGAMYSLGLHAPIFSPLRVALDLVFFREARAMRKIAKKLEEEVYYFTVPLPGSWRETLEKLREQGKISRQQFRGELTSMLVASFSLASALGAALMCLAACPAYVDKIRKDPAFSTFFLMEVLRLYPSFRQFGYERPPHHKDHSFGAATDFMIAVYALHRHPDEWKFPNAFWPERFVEKGTQGGFKYLPFGMGKRSCPGRLYSMRLLSEVIKYVCSENSGIVLQKKNSLPVGSNGRLVSFVIDDGLIFQRIHSGEQKCTVT